MILILILWVFCQLHDSNEKTRSSPSLVVHSHAVWQFQAHCCQQPLTVDTALNYLIISATMPRQLQRSTLSTPKAKCDVDPLSSTRNGLCSWVYRYLTAIPVTRKWIQFLANSPSLWQGQMRREKQMQEANFDGKELQWTVPNLSHARARFCPALGTMGRV